MIGSIVPCHGSIVKKTEHGKVIVTCLKCVVCTKHKESIKNRRNFNSKWIDGAATMKLVTFETTPSLINTLMRSHC